MFSSTCDSCDKCRCHCTCYEEHQAFMKAKELRERPARLDREIAECRKMILFFGKYYRIEGYHKNFIKQKIRGRADRYLHLYTERAKIGK